MKKRLYSLFLLLFATSLVYAQREPVYSTSSLEIIFSVPKIIFPNSQEETSSVVRFAPVFNYQNRLHFNLAPFFGLQTGFSIRNLGFIFDVPEEFREDPTQSLRKKVRTYTLGVPFGIKLGNLDSDTFIYLGYELEFPIHYKEKTFVGEQKEKFTVFFSERMSTLLHSVYLGVQFPYGANIKFKYYPSRFFKDSYAQNMPRTSLPYNQLDVNIFYFSLNLQLLKNTHIYYKDDAFGGERKVYYTKRRR